MYVVWPCVSAVAGGAERATLQVLALLRERGHTVQMIGVRGSPVLELGRNLGVSGRPLPFGTMLPLAMRWANESASPGIVLATGAVEWMWASLRPRSRRMRLVLARHMALPLSRRMRWLAARRADAVIAVSHAVRDSLIRSPAIPADRLHVIYNPVRFDARPSVPSTADRQRARHALGVPAEGRWVGFFGGGDPNKGVDDVIAAVRRADAHLGPPRLLVGGRRSARHPAIDQLKRDGRLHDLGETDRMDAALTAADVVVMATRSRLSEALPATLIEAMACGTPVLAYARGGMAEVIGADREAGRLARPDDVDDLARCLIEMLADVSGAERMAAAGLRRARTLFDPQLAADRYEHLFRSLAG
jgi:glycosyltransferase involved in cell wall biosynthesis